MRRKPNICAACSGVTLPPWRRASISRCNASFCDSARPSSSRASRYWMSRARSSFSTRSRFLHPASNSEPNKVIVRKKRRPAGIKEPNVFGVPFLASNRMTNDEISNDEGMTNDQARRKPTRITFPISVFRISSFFRHSSFRIRHSYPYDIHRSARALHLLVLHLWHHRDAGQHVVNQAVLLRLGRRHEVVAIGVLLDLVKRLAGVFEQDLAEHLLEPLILFEPDHDFRSRAFH